MKFDRISALLTLTCFAVIAQSLPARAESVDAIAFEEQAISVQDLAPAPIQDPGVRTSATALFENTAALPQTEVDENAAEVPDNQVAQFGVTPGTATRGVASYVGVAGNIGLSGRTALGETNFAVISKIGLTPTFSARPGVVIGDRTTFVLPVTYDFQPTVFTEDAPVSFVPYGGAGVAFSTGDDSRVGLLLTGGVDVPIGQNFTATAGTNVAFLRRTEIGLMIGVGYNFPGF
ncbi:MAG: hypothetical protein F6K32_19995 [Desertifilum sp. SIO1I2]|nr:hypothetical protein [Desertifilum sp. SIO1I2]